MRTKLKPIRWYFTFECRDWADNYNEYKRAIYQPAEGWRPVDSKYHRQSSRFPRKAALAKLKEITQP